MKEKKEFELGVMDLNDINDLDINKKRLSKRKKK